MINIEQISSNCKIFIEQFNYCKTKELNKAKNMNTEFEIKNCMIYFNLIKLCIYSGSKLYNT